MPRRISTATKTVSCPTCGNVLGGLNAEGKAWTTERLCSHMSIDSYPNELVDQAIFGTGVKENAARRRQAEQALTEIRQGIAKAQKAGMMWKDDVVTIVARERA